MAQAPGLLQSALQKFLLIRGGENVSHLLVLLPTDHFEDISQVAAGLWLLRKVPGDFNSVAVDAQLSERSWERE